MSTTTDWLDAIEARTEAATEGPWHACSASNGKCECGHVWEPSGMFPVAQSCPKSFGEGIYGDAVWRNAQFIAAARTDVPALVKELRRCREAMGFIHAQTTGSWQSDPDAWMDAIRETAEKALSGGPDD